MKTCFPQVFVTLRFMHKRPLSLERASSSAVITTEKDAQRIVDTKKVPAELKERIFQVPIDVNFLSESEKAVFETTLLSFLHPQEG